MKDLTRIGHLDPDLVNESRFDFNSLTWGPEYRFPIWSGVPACITVEDGWGKKHTAPSAPGFYTLYEYVVNNTLQDFAWEKEEQP